MSVFRQPTNPSITMMQLNAENLFIYLDHLPKDKKNFDVRLLSEQAWQELSSASVSNKPLSKTVGLAEAILDIQPDILALNEVGGKESLKNFNELFLGDRYIVHLQEGNSSRGIDVGYLIRKDWPYRFELITHKDRPLNFLYPHEQRMKRRPKSHLFSRDCAELRVFDKDSSTPDLICFLVHLKSKLDPEGIDPFGTQRREAELKSLVEIYKESKEQFPNAERVVFGDFNGIARKDKTDSEFLKLYEETDLLNSLEEVGLEGEWSTTQVQFDRSGRRYLLQFDYIFVSPGLVPRIDKDHTYVYRYKSDLGVHSALPTNFDEKMLCPSDHYPVVMTLKSGQ